MIGPSKKSTRASIAVATGLLGAVAIYLWRDQVHDEAVAKTIAAELRENLPVAQSDETTFSGNARIPAAAESVSPASAKEPPAPDNLDKQRIGPADKEQLKEMRPSLDAHVKRLYEDFASKAGMNAEETEKFLALVSDQQFALYEGFGDKPLSESETQAAFNSWKENRDAAIAAYLRAERAAGFREYERSIGARYEVEAIRVELENAQLPMTEVQRKSLIDKAIEHGAFAPFPQFQGNSVDADMQEMVAQSDQRDQRMHDVARGILTIDQLSHYEQFVTRRHNLMETSMQTENDRKKDTK